MEDTETLHNDSVNQTYIDNSRHQAYDVGEFITLYIEGITLFGGLLGNVFVFVIFGRTDYYTKSIHVYIRSLSAFNIVVIIGPLMTQWLNYNFFPERKHPVACALFITIGRFCVDCEAWVIAAMSANQYVAVMHPHHFTTLCTVKRSRLIVLVIAVFAISKNVFTLQTAGFVEYRDGTKLCVAVPDSGNRLIIAYQWVDVFVACVLPFCCMTYLNIRVGLRFGSTGRHAAKVRQLTAILIVVSIIFILATLCKKISAIVLTYNFRHADDMSYLMLTISIARVVWCACNAANMWVYLALCPHFRSDVLRVVCPRWKSPIVEPSSSGHVA